MCNPYMISIASYFIATIETNNQYKYLYLDYNWFPFASDMGSDNEWLQIKAAWDRYIYMQISHEHVW